MIADASYVLGDRAPARIEEPSEPQRVAKTLAAACAGGETVVAFGGGTKQGVGNPPARYTIALSLRRLDRVAQYDPRDLTVGVEAGMTVGALTRVLEDYGQFIPFDTPRPERATVGGTLASGWTGPRRSAYGRLRDLLIGTTVALVDGTLASAGGMVVKNVTGYDTSKLYVGSLGTLGVIVRANFKALPRPASMRLAVAPLGDDVRMRAADALASLDIEPTVALLLDGYAGEPLGERDEGLRLVVAFEGSEAVIDRATRNLRSALGKCGVANTRLVDGRDAASRLQRTIDVVYSDVEDRSLTYRQRGLPATAAARAAAAADDVRALGARCDAVTDTLGGDVIVRVSADHASALDAALEAVDATVRGRLPGADLVGGDPDLRTRLNAWGSMPATLEAQRALKARFDPTGTLAPGRFAGGI